MSILIGGDTVGIRQLAASIEDYRSRIQTVHTTLDQVADNLVHDAGWHGDAADAFRGKWEFDAGAAAALDGVLEVFSTALSNLATGLDEAQSMLSSAVNAADADHLKLDQDGNVLTQDVPTNQVAALKQAESAYLASVKAAQQHARQARSDFAAALQVFLYGLGVGNPSTKLDGLAPSDYDALASVVRDYVFVSGPLEDNLKTRLAKTAERGSEIADELDKMEDPASKKGLKQFNKLLRKGGRWKKIQGAIAKVHLFNEKLDNLEEKTHTKVLDQGFLNSTESEVGKSGKFAKFLEDTPGVDILLAGYATVDMATRDHNRGWSWTHAIAADGAANLTGLVVGTAATRIPFVGPVVGPVLGYGSAAAVTEWTHNVEWGQNIHDHGAVVGTGYSIGEGLVKTWGNDFVGVGKKLWDSL